MENKITQAGKDLLTRNPDMKEGQLTQKIEQQTGKIPSVGFLSLAIGSMVLSAGLEIFSRKKEYGNFVGLWAPTFMLLGIYNKLVKLEGSDRFNKYQEGQKAA